MIGRALILLGLFGCAFAACTGVKGPVLTERAKAAGGAAGAFEAGAAGELATAGSEDAGASNEAGAAGAPPTEKRDSCPARFQEACSPVVLVDNKDATASGKLFTDAIADPTTTLTCVTRDVCNLFFRKATEIRPVAQISIIVEDFAGVSETYASGTGAVIDISSRYLQAVADAHGDVAREIGGIFYYHATNIYQFDGGDGTTNSWIVEGVANYSRHVAGYLTDDQRMKGGKYNAGGTTTAFFLVWLDSQYLDFVYELNQSLNPANTVAWTPQAFQDITGLSVDQLWTAYQATL